MTLKVDRRIEILWKIEHYPDGYGDTEDESDDESHRITFSDQFTESLCQDKGPEFWNKLNFSEVVANAISNKYAFNMAYNYDYCGFKTFFDQYWHGNILNLSKIKFTDPKGLYSVLNLFTFKHNYSRHTFSRAKILLPEGIPIDTLWYLSAPCIVFRTKGHYPLRRVKNYPRFNGYNKGVKIIILGSYQMGIENPIIDILISYSYLAKLILKHVHFSSEIINCLSLCRCDEFSIINCRTSQYNMLNLASTISKMVKLKSLSYKSNVTHYMSYIIKRNNESSLRKYFTKELVIDNVPIFIIQQLHLMNKLEILKISLILNKDNINLLKQQAHLCSSLKFIVLYNMDPKNSLSFNEIHNTLHCQQFKIKIYNKFNSK